MINLVDAKMQKNLGLLKPSIRIKADPNYLDRLI